MLISRNIRNGKCSFTAALYQESSLAAFQDIVSYSTSTLLSFWSPETGFPQTKGKKTRLKKKRDHPETQKKTYEVQTLNHGKKKPTYGAPHITSIVHRISEISRYRKLITVTKENEKKTITQEKKRYMIQTLLHMSEDTNKAK